MALFNLPLPYDSKTKLHSLINWIKKHGIQTGCGLLLLYLLTSKNVTLQISFQEPGFQRVVPSVNPAKNHSPLAALSVSASGASKKQQAYIRRFAKTAVSEMHKYGIPASIKLAQGLLESQAGNSPLAIKNNNHFGIKCFSKNCSRGHCTNFSDDSHKDFFRNYQNAWESYRAHSEFLTKDRYAHLLGETDYRAWAKGLAAAGYATDPDYADKLIQIIEKCGLYQYDLRQG